MNELIERLSAYNNYNGPFVLSVSRMGTIHYKVEDGLIFVAEQDHCSAVCGYELQFDVADEAYVAILSKELPTLEEVNMLLEKQATRLAEESAARVATAAAKAAADAESAAAAAAKMAPLLAAEKHLAQLKAERDMDAIRAFIPKINAIRRQFAS